MKQFKNYILTVTWQTNADDDSSNVGFQNFDLEFPLTFLICVFVGTKYGSSIKFNTLQDLKSKIKKLLEKWNN